MLQRLDRWFMIQIVQVLLLLGFMLTSLRELGWQMLTDVRKRSTQVPASV